ncbi:hypothetical protein [Bacillus sp. T33-2]|uniref:hypothetical protein n=1 Tax=Bacillus sp. T33-2 TaxID=2054168 RepID=UPI000C7719CD|nr:hypothetical protein [Bacillus sp. T33-2]PLR93229.1 hypothetical protein CVD19_19695 [Bacillus sp. T33-2]
MKLNVTVDIDWLEEDESIDEAIKRQIISGVVKRISDDVISSVKRDAENQVQERVSELVDATYNEFLSGTVTLTDRWGDVTKKDVSIKSLIKNQCDNWLTEKVNDRGEASSYSANYTRVEYFVKNQIEKQTKEMSNQIVTKVNQEMKKFITDSLKDSIGEKLLKEIGVEELLKKVKG